MIYSTNNFKKIYHRLSKENQKSIFDIVQAFNRAPQEEKNTSLKSWWGPNGNAKWTGISKTLYHLYPQGRNSQHRLFYCYTTDIDDKTREKWNMSEGLIFVDYVTDHDKETYAALEFEKGNIRSYHTFDLYENTTNINDKLHFSHYFWFLLTNHQNKVLNLPQPSLIKGSAGTGKTIISFDLLKQWIYYQPEGRYLYVTYTDELIRKAYDTLQEDGVNLDSESDRYHCRKHIDLVDEFKKQYTVISEREARKFIKENIEDYKRHNKIEDKEIYQDYFIYSYIRGIIKGHKTIKRTTYRVNNEKFSLAKHKIFKKLPKILSTKEKDLIIRYLNDLIKEDELSNKSYNSILKPRINTLIINENKGTKSEFKKSKNDAIDLALSNAETYRIINESREETTFSDYITKEEVIKKLRDDGLLDEDIKFIIDIYENYQRFLESKGLLDDNDYAKLILNTNFSEEQKYDGIIVDEVQDLTEIQIESIVSLVKENSNNISFFGDPNQTINPTVYDYGRFNSLVYEKTNDINRENLKTTHRCGPNLLEYINHLTALRGELKLTTDTSDLKPEISAVDKVDTNWACFVEDKDVINFILSEFTRAEDCLLIVDNDNSRKKVIDKIKSMEDVDDSYLEETVKTVQEVKGLESKNVIIYNLISDNIDIFNNLIGEYNKVSTMTFNKLYVSSTRAEDSLLICEDNLTNDKVKKELFYFDGNLMAENITEDEVGLYLKTSLDPIKFRDQAISAMEESNYKKALSKINISIRNFLIQFREDEDLSVLNSIIMDDTKYDELLYEYNLDEKDKINIFINKFEMFLEDNKKLIDEDMYKLLMLRREVYEDSIRIKEICILRNEFEILIDDLSDEEKQTFYLERFLVLEDYISSMFVIQKMVNDVNKKHLEVITKYFFGYDSYENSRRSFDNIIFSNNLIYEKLFNKRIKNDGITSLEERIIKLEEITL